MVPPYWYHHVETMEESVSVNVWSDAPEYYAMNEMYVKFILSGTMLLCWLHVEWFSSTFFTLLIHM